MKKETKGLDVIRICLATLVVIMWITAIIMSMFKAYNIPSSIEIGFTVVLGFVFGTSTLPAIIKYWRERKE